MKFFTLGVALLTCLPVFPQDKSTRHEYTLFRTRDGFRVVVDSGSGFEVIAKSLEDLKPLPAVRFKGGVEITLNRMELRADEVDYHWDTGEIEPFGNVHLKPVNP